MRVGRHRRAFLTGIAHHSRPRGVVRHSCAFVGRVARGVALGFVVRHGRDFGPGVAHYAGSSRSRSSSPIEPFKTTRSPAKTVGVVTTPARTPDWKSHRT